MSTFPPTRIALIGGALALAIGGTAAAVEATAPADDLDATTEVADLFSGEDTGNAEAFATWVESLPEDWGCVRGALVSTAAKGPHRGEFTAPEFASAEEAAEALGLEGQCVEAVLGDDAEGDDDTELAPQDAERPERPERPEAADRGGAPEQPGKPDHAGTRSGKSS